MQGRCQWLKIYGGTQGHASSDPSACMTLRGSISLNFVLEVPHWLHLGPTFVQQVWGTADILQVNKFPGDANAASQQTIF